MSYVIICAVFMTSRYTALPILDFAGRHD